MAEEQCDYWASHVIEHLCVHDSAQNRVYPDPDNMYLTLCEVAVYGNCPALPDDAMGGTLSAAAAAAAESLGENCQITMGTERLSFADAERACMLDGTYVFE